MLLSRSNGATSVIVRVKILDSSATTGAGLTGLTSASTGLIISTIADVEATATTYTAAGSTTETITTLGTYAAPTATKCRFKEVDATNHKGVYELHFADARYAISGAKHLLVSMLGVTNMAQTDFIIDLQAGADVRYWTGTAATAGAIPAVAAGGSGGILISGSNSGTTTLAALTVTGATTHTGVTTHTGNVVLSDGLTISAPSTTNRAGLSIAGNGTGAGILATAGATGIGISAVGGATSGSAIKATGTAGNAIALELVGQGSAAGLKSTGGATGNGFTAVGGGTSGHGIQCTVTSGNEIDADLTGAITGSLSGSVGSVTAQVTANVAQIGGTNVTATAGIPSVNLVQWKGSAPANLSNTFVQSSIQELASAIITATSIAADAIGASELATDAVTEIVSAVWAKVIETNASITAQQAMSVFLSALAGVTASGGNTLKDPSGTTTRIAATTDGSNNRTVMILTPSS